MLDFIRQNSQSLWIKIAFGIIIVVFIFLGVGSLQNSSGVVATVNGTDISEHEFLKAYDQQLNVLQTNFPQIGQEELKMLRFPHLVLEGLVLQTLLDKEAEKMGVNVSPKELLKIIASYPFTHNQQGVFDKDIYLAALKNAGQSPKAFEEEVSNGLLELQFQNFFAQFAYASPVQARQFFNFQYEQRAFEAYVIKASDFLASATVDDERLKQLYEESKTQFIVPESVDIEFLELTPATLKKPENITQQEIENAYAQNKARYDLPELVTASHILIRVPENASPEEEEKALAKIKDVQQKIKDGEKFEKIAKEVSEDPASGQHGGKLGTFTRGQMVKPFEEVAFSQEIDTVSEPVRTDFGYHLIYVEGKEEAKELAKEDFVKVIGEDLAIQKAQENLQSTVDSLLLQVHSNTSLAEIAKKEGLEVQSTGLNSYDKLTTTFNLTSADLELIKSMNEGQFLSSAIPTSHGFIIARVLKKEAEKTRSFEEVKEELLPMAKQEKANEEAEAKAKELLANISNIDKTKLTQATIERSGASSIGYNVELADKIFTLPANSEWIQEVYTLRDIEGVSNSNDYVLVKPTEIIHADEELYNADEDLIIAEMLKAKEQMLYTTFIESLRANAKVYIVNQAYFQ